MARMECDPGEIYCELTTEFGEPLGYPHSLAALLALYSRALVLMFLICHDAHKE
jgi:hypothetical protein